MSYNKDSITIIGETNFRNKIPFGIKEKDRMRHTYVVGKTGTGKSVLLENMIIDDIREGKGVGFIDPHGESAETILKFIPEERLSDVIYFDPSDVSYPIGFNPLEKVSEEHIHLVASGIMAVFKKVWADVWSNRMQYIMNNTLLALLEYPGATLLDVMRMLTNKSFRDGVIKELTDPVVKTFWVEEFSKWTAKYADEANAAVLNKIGQLVANPLIRHIVGQPHSTINLRQIMDDGKILIMNLSKGRMGEDNSALIGAMFITKIQMAAMSRADISNLEDRRPFHLYIDEFQNFSTDSFADILSEARKYGLSLTIGHQYIKQLVDPVTRNTKVRDAVFGNVGTLISFRVGAEDAEFLEKEFEPEFMMNDMVNLPNYNIYVKLMIDGVSSKPFSATTFPPHKLEGESFVDVIIENSRTKYAVPVAEVEKKIGAQYEAAAKSIGEKIQRKGEEKLDVLKKEPPKKKAPPDIDKEKLRGTLKIALEQNNIEDESGS